MTTKTIKAAIVLYQELEAFAWERASLQGSHTRKMLCTLGREGLRLSARAGAPARRRGPCERKGRCSLAISLALLSFGQGLILHLGPHQPVGDKHAGHVGVSGPEAIASIRIFRSHAASVQ